MVSGLLHEPPRGGMLKDEGEKDESWLVADHDGEVSGRSEEPVKYAGVYEE